MSRKISGVLDILKRSFEIYIKNIKNFIVISSIIFIFFAIPKIIIFQMYGSLSSPILIALGLLSIIFSLISMAIGIVSNGIFILAADDISSGRRFDPNQIFINVFKKIFSIIFLSFLLVLVVGGSSFILIIPGIIVSVYCVFSLYSLLLDNKKGLDALVESFNYVKGNWWAVLGRIVSIGILSTIFMIVIVLILFGIYDLFGGDIVTLISASDVFVLNIESEIFNLILSFTSLSILLPIVHIYFYLIYRELKVKSITVDESYNKKLKNAGRILIAFGIIVFTLFIIFSTIIILSTIKSNLNTGYTRGHRNTYINKSEDRLNMMYNRSRE